MRKLTQFVSVAGLAVFAFSSPLRAANDSFYQGKTISVMIGYGPGGTYNEYGRMLARYLGRHVPGKPQVIVENVPGAGSVKLANTLYNLGPHDGTAIGLVGFALPVQQVLGSPGYKFVASKFNWIGRISTGAGAVVSWATLPIKTIQDVKKMQLFIASPGPATSSSLYPTLLNHFIGTKFKIVYGYAGTRQTLLAMERGEVGAVQLALMDPAFVQLKREKKINVLFQVTVKRDPSLANVPTAVELVRNPSDRDVMKLFSLINDIGRSFFVPPGVPLDRVATLRDSFLKTVSDPDLIAFAKKAHLPMDVMRGEDVQKMIEDIGNTPQPIIQKALKAENSKAAG